MGEWFIGEIRLFPYVRVPGGWHICDGSELPVAGNVVLASLLGNSYGGNGTTTFNLPDLRGRVPAGVGEDIPNIGMSFGEESVKLSVETMPSHTHIVNAITSEGTQTLPLAGLPATMASDAPAIYGPPTSSTGALNSDTITSCGDGVAHENRQPTIALQYCIALEGQYPPQS
ncbi:MAG: tail fiber protein [Rhodospirillaceae bacterium]|nr:tail fiber protein [Rhodospirillaceae bacterium]